MWVALKWGGGGKGASAEKEVDLCSILLLLIIRVHGNTFVPEI